MRLSKYITQDDTTGQITVCCQQCKVYLPTRDYSEGMLASRRLCRNCSSASTRVAQYRRVLKAKGPNGVRALYDRHVLNAKQLAEWCETQGILL